MTAEEQRTKIAQACRLVLSKGDEVQLDEYERPYRLQGHHWNGPQHIVSGWVCTTAGNPKGVQLRGGCSQAVRDKATAERWASRDPNDLVVPVEFLADVPDYLGDLNAMAEAEKLPGLDQDLYSKWLWVVVTDTPIPLQDPWDVVRDNDFPQFDLYSAQRFRSATSAQRAKAVCLTLDPTCFSPTGDIPTPQCPTK